MYVGMKRSVFAALFVSVLFVFSGCPLLEGSDESTREDVVAASDTGSGVCTPDCEGRECGDDGCGGSCGSCFTMEGAVEPDLCRADGHCADCLADCEGKECGDDGCGGSCGNCFTLEGGLDNSLCTAEFVCSQCSPDCADKNCGDNGCGGTCGTCPGDQGCVAGECMADDLLCPEGQFCTEFTEGSDKGCLMDEEIPPFNDKQCHEKEYGCDGNFSCLYLDEEGAESVCVENCGTCPDGLECGDVTGDGYLGCMSFGSIPDGAIYGCHELEGGCPGNATCFYLNSEYTESACIDNCSACRPGSCPAGKICDGVFCVPEPCTEGSCPEGENCVGGICIPDSGPGPGAYTGGLEECDLPPIKCEGTSAYCGELIQFDPAEGYGYIDYPENGETWENQYRSWLRRDVVMGIQYAAAKVACLAEDWEFGNGGPVGLIDMSEENGDIPGTSIGSPGHPSGTHTDGFDIDVSYYQVNTANNAARPICDHYEGGAEAYHCTAPPHLLDPWRQALFIGALFENPLLRVIGCDGQAGPIIDAAMDTLCDGGWIPSAACKNNKLTYETVDQGWGWFYFHHHHIHVSFNQGSYRGGQCLVPGCLDQHLQHFLARYGLAKGQKNLSGRPDFRRVRFVK